MMDLLILVLWTAGVAAVSFIGGCIFAIETYYDTSEEEQQEDLAP